MRICPIPMTSDFCLSSKKEYLPNSDDLGFLIVIGKEKFNAEKPDRITIA